MKLLKKFNFFIITSTIILCMTQNAFGRINLVYNGEEHIYKGSPINLVVNDSLLTDLPLEPIVINQRTLVPAREVFEELGAVVDYKSVTREIFVAYNENLIVLTIDSPEFYVNDLVLDLEVAPIIINGKTMLPFRAVAEAIGLTVNWDGSTRTITVNDDTTDIPIVIEDIEEVKEEAKDVEKEVEKEVPLDSSKEENKSDVDINNNNDVPTISYGQGIDISSKEIVNMNNPKVDILSVTLPNNEDAIIIKASGPMSKIDKFLLEDNRLVIDIYNSTNKAIASQNATHPAFSSIRTGQNQLDPTPITRIVTDLIGTVEFAVELSNDRTELRIIFSQNTISDVTFEKDNGNEYIKIYGDVSPNVLSSISIDNKVLTLELPSSIISKDIKFNVDSKYIADIAAPKNNNKITLNIKERPGISIKKESTYTKVTLKELSDENMVYDSGTNTFIIKKAGTDLTASKIKLNENFIVNHKLTVILDGDFKDYLGNDNNTSINDNTIESYKITKTSGDNTEIVFALKRFGTFAITENTDSIFLSFKNPKEIYEKVLVLDPGHGGNEPGVVFGNGTHFEKDLNLSIALKTRDLLEAAGYKVFMTRTTDAFIPLVTIGTYSTAMGDLLLSVHANSAGSNTVPSGIETLWLEHDNDSTIGISSLEAAKILQKSLISNLGALDRGPKRSRLVIFKNSNIPSILAEVGFVTNPDEVKKLLDDKYQGKIAAALTEGVENIFNVFTPIR